MRYAYCDGELDAEAQPGARGVCASCGGNVIAKTGTIVTWHWAHQSETDCDTWAEPDSSWHRAWQDRFPPGWREVPIGNHRADIRTPGGLVVEVQHSHLSPTEIRIRERYYGQMVWVFDTVESYAEGRFDLRRHPKPDDVNYVTFRWKQRRKSVIACRAPYFLDLGAEVVATSRLYPDPPTGGYGHVYPIADFVKAVTNWTGL